MFTILSFDIAILHFPEINRTINKIIDLSTRPVLGVSALVIRRNTNRGAGHKRLTKAGTINKHTQKTAKEPSINHLDHSKTFYTQAG
jgi:hypothetical protein